MHWNSVSEFLAMGGYGFYVWGSFGITFFSMILELWQLYKRSQHASQAISQIVKQAAF